MPQITTISRHFVQLPVEIQLHVFELLDTQAIIRLSITCWPLHRVFLLHKAKILWPVLRREFSPLPELLQVYTAVEQDLAHRITTCLPKRIVYQSCESTDGIVLCEGTDLTSRAFRGSVLRSNNNDVPGNKPIQSQQIETTVYLKDSDLDAILSCCLVVRKWENLVPQLHWRKSPAKCRLLRVHEKFRLRRSIYRWWLYTLYFHASFSGPRPGLPEAFQDDPRTSLMRRHSSNELIELMDMLRMVGNCVEKYLIPILAKDRILDLSRNSHEADVDLLCWKDEHKLHRIIRTYQKLDPAELMYYIEHAYNCPKQRLIGDIKRRRVDFSAEQESMFAAIMAVLTERPMADTNFANCTIIDNEYCIDSESDTYLAPRTSDGVVDGSLPPHTPYVRPTWPCSPPGDDGSDIEDAFV